MRKSCTPAAALFSFTASLIGCSGFETSAPAVDAERPMYRGRGADYYEEL